MGLGSRSHKQLIDVLVAQLLRPRLAADEFAVVTLPAKKVPLHDGSHVSIRLWLAITHRPPPPRVQWKWRSNASSLHFSRAIPAVAPGGVLFCSSVLNLAEVVALRTDLLPAHKVLYFHENQLAYPARHAQDRDYHLSYMQGVPVCACVIGAVWTP